MTAFHRLLPFALAIVLSSPAAFAQDQPTTKPPAPAPAPPISDQAKDHFSAGVALLQDPEGEKVEEAYRQFKTAYDLSGSAKILGNMGFCAMRLERDGEAIDAYSRYLREVPDIDTEERAQIVRDLQTLTVGVARITIETNVPGAIVVDERVPVRGSHVTNAYGPVSGNKLEIGIRPGHHLITAKLAGREDATWELEAYAGSKEHHTFVLKEPVRAPPPNATPVEKPSLTGPIIVVAAGGALVVAGGITGIIALRKTGDISDRCPNDVCPRSFNLDSERSSARTFVGITDLLLAVGTVAMVGGLYWVYRTSTASSEPPKAAPAGAGGGASKAKTRAASSFFGDWRLAL